MAKLEQEPCSLANYRQVVTALPRPATEQIRNYIQFVSEAHSWYKHLPLLPPAPMFCFFVDPYSGHDSIRQPGGGVVHKERTETSKRFHYTWMTTKDYRAAFGYLSYACEASPQFIARAEGAERDYADLPVFSTAEGMYRIPPKVAEVGSVEITAVVHHLTARPWVWETFLPRILPKIPRHWPEETGGDETLRRIMDVCERKGRDSDEIDSELESLLLPEKKRLQANMTQAINRVLDLLYQIGTVGT